MNAAPRATAPGRRVHPYWNSEGFQMDTFVTFTILGLVLGSVYAIAASGLVLTYNTSGIFNFAHGAQAMLGAFLYWQFRYGWGMPTPLALLLTIGVAGP